ncbi:MAG: hypothetical protein ACYTEZ_06070 [Planctomycetota bacterium]|jgi:hypothetical protein
MRTLVLLLCVLPAAADPLDDTLARAGFTRARLGWTPRGWWARFPRGVTHKLDHFDDLFAEPLATVPFTRVLGRATRDLLGPEGLAKQPDRGAHALYRLVHLLGINRRHGGIRPYSPNLLAKPTPLDEAILQLYRYARRQTKFVTFNTESPYPLVEKDLKAKAAKLPPEMSRILGQLVLNLVDAHRWAELAFRNVPLEDRVAASKRLDLGMESVDALEYPAVCDDVAKAWDEASLWYAAGKCVEALDTARRQLATAKGDGSFAWETPLGWIRVYGRADDIHIDPTDALLIVDLGGEDSYGAGVGASTATRPLGLCLDMEGNDVYAGGRGTQGAGICGVGILLDVEGHDTYGAEQYAQGAGQFGFGALIDLAGDDRHIARWSAQGCGYFGVGMLLDAAGKDTYELHADGQGFGGVGGVGVLADRTGDDTYLAEPDAAKSGRPSYHSELKISVSNAQGCAMGRRGDGADGHNWAGGLGALIDVEGNDRYRSGNWSMGTGYWFGMGVLWDGAGDDRYQGHVWSQGTGAHFCLGALIDEGGNDHHVGERASLAFGHDFAIALLVDQGGNDHYECAGDGVGFSINRSVAMLIDVGGDDTYEANTVPGFARYDARFADRTAHSTYWVDSSSIGLFLDVGGTDRYRGEDRNARTWGDAHGSDNWKVRNVGVGADVAEGAINWDALPVKERRR